jgi:hypothetical protein
MSLAHISVILTGSELFSGKDAVTLFVTKTVVHNAVCRSAGGKDVTDN